MLLIESTMADSKAGTGFKSIVLVSLLLLEQIYCFFDLEEVNNLKYGVEISDVPVLFSEARRDNILHISSKFGQVYQCEMPVRKIKEDSTKSEKDSLVLGNKMVINTLDKALNNTCFTTIKGWWTYKYCYKKTIEQYHQTGSGEVSGDVIILGKFDTETDWNNKTLSKGKPKDVLYHDQQYINGSFCYLTETPRQTKVKLYCDEDALVGSISRIDEPESCSYEFKVVTSALCNLPWFKPMKSNNKKDITCSPALKKIQYNKYIKKENERKEKEAKSKLEKTRKALEDKLTSEMDGFENLANIFTLDSSEDMSLSSPDASKKDSGKETMTDSEEVDKEDKDENKAKGEENEGTKERQKEVMNALKGLLSAFNIKPEDMKIVSYDKNGGKVKVKGTVPSDSAEIENELEKKSEQTNVKSDDKQNKQKIKSDIDVEPPLNKLEKEVLDDGDIKGEKLEPSENTEKLLTKEVEGMDSRYKAAETDDNDDVDVSPDQEYSEELALLGKNYDKEDPGENSITELEKGFPGEKKPVDNLNHILKKTKHHLNTMVKKRDEMGKKLVKSYQSTKLSINQHLQRLKEKMDETKMETKNIKDANKEELADNIIQELNKNVEKYLSKLSRLNKKMVAINNLVLKSQDTFKELFQRRADEGELGEELQVQLLETLRDTLKIAMENDEETTKKEKEDNKDDKEEDVEKEEKQKLPFVLEKVGKMIRDGLRTDKITEAQKDTEEEASSVTAKGKNGDGIKFRVRKMSKEAMDELMKDKDNDDGSNNDENSQENLAVDSNDDVSLGRRRLKRATKKMEDMIRLKLKNAGIDIDGKVKVKVITNPKYFDKREDNENDMRVLNADDANQFQTLLGGILGGHHERAKEQKRQKSLENKYNYVWADTTQNIVEDDSNSEDEKSSDNLLQL